MIYLGTDHAGFELKEKIKIFLKEEGFEVEDLGTHSPESSDDYPDFVIPVAEHVAEKSSEGVKGIIFGLSGQGEAMAANRIKGARAAVFYGGSHEIITLSREHNDANILSLGAKFVNEEEAKEVVRLWLETDFSEEERHQRRIEKLDSFNN